MAQYTTEEALAFATQAGFRVNKRLVRTWTQQGLINRREIRGRGRGRGVIGVWRENDLRLFMVLLGHRARGVGPAVLSNIVVWLWLAWGDSYVPTDQARRALTTWIKMHRTHSWKSSKQSVKEFERKYRNPGSHRVSRSQFRDELAEVSFTGVLDAEKLESRAAIAFDPTGKDRPRGPTGAQITAEGYVTLLKARLDAMEHQDQFDDRDLAEGRALYLQARLSYAAEWKRLAADEEMGAVFERPDLNAVINSACLDLITAMGLMRVYANASP
jgi:hypothetical protein